MATMTHRVELTPFRRRPDAAPTTAMTYEGRPIGTSDAPIYDAARHLLNAGLAQPEDRIETWRGTSHSMSAVVGTAAGWTVHESDPPPASGRVPVFRLAKYRPYTGPGSEGIEGGCAALVPEIAEMAAVPVTAHREVAI